MNGFALMGLPLQHTGQFIGERAARRDDILTILARDTNKMLFVLLYELHKAEQFSKHWFKLI